MDGEYMSQIHVTVLAWSSFQSLTQGTELILHFLQNHKEHKVKGISERNTTAFTYN